MATALIEDRDGDGQWFLDGETGEVLRLDELDDNDAASLAFVQFGATVGAQVTVQPTDYSETRRFACWLHPQQASVAILQPQM
jgi:hypothetical protein